ncbi:MAG: hypothetical protein JXM70_16870 [Pirellulales bacterium]|nr:hypothetical protein [Pirellulales bacterium]
MRYSRVRPRRTKAVDVAGKHFLKGLYPIPLNRQTWEKAIEENKPYRHA